MKSNIFILCISLFVLTACSSDDATTNPGPDDFNLLTPNNSNNVDLLPELTWEAATHPNDDNITYDVYLGTQNPPQNIIATNHTFNFLDLEEELEPETTYYWQVVAKDSNDNTSTSNLASFTVREKTTEELLRGKWFYDSIEGEEPLNTCQKNSFLNFKENGSLEIKRFNINNNQECVFDTSILMYQTTNEIQIEVSMGEVSETWNIVNLDAGNLSIDAEGILLNLVKE
ncbi:hypothetical protein [Haloflavibacter putidus]|uniref:Fibronectin type-III domain-containing protein n=1 Tax=Haloflavibacter putidus TaxID=2576776 RepID=A0A507ZK66_9FLAO|nr:hypothetical protein [Haloflavibacter putidus]TQD36963.1 hypothetical protein FKR84_10155 [Haloflavibacter putidus]